MICNFFTNVYNTSSLYYILINCKYTIYIYIYIYIYLRKFVVIYIYNYIIRERKLIKLQLIAIYY